MSVELLAFVQDQATIFQRLLGLDNWVIEVLLAEAKDEMQSTVPLDITWAVNYRFATIRVNPDVTGVEHWLSGSEGQRRVLHELVHLLLADIQNFMRNQFVTTGLFWNLYNEMDQQTVDTITNIIWRLVQRVDIG